MPKKQTQSKLSLWKNDPYCYWCGRLTVIVKQGQHDGSLPDDAATIDHIRSRLSPQRKKREQGIWTVGGRVIACHRCNGIRGKHEEAFFREIDPEAMYDRGYSRPARKSLLTAQSRLANAILALLRNGGEVIGSVSHVQEVYKHAAELEAEYAAKKAEEAARKPLTFCPDFATLPASRCID